MEGEKTKDQGRRTKDERQKTKGRRAWVAWQKTCFSIYIKVWEFGGRGGAGSRYGVKGYGGFGLEIGTKLRKSGDIRENLFCGWKGVRYRCICK
jgi:hypothetical protein